MTFEQIALTHLQSAMFPKDADAVIVRMKAAEENKDMFDRWAHDEDGYPPEMKLIVIYSANVHAVKWIDENVPRAWYRPMFANAIMNQ